MTSLASQNVLNFEVLKKGARFGCPIGRLHSVGVPILSTSVFVGPREQHRTYSFPFICGDIVVMVCLSGIFGKIFFFFLAFVLLWL